MEAGGDVLGRAMDVFDELEKADGLGDGGGPGVFHLPADVADLGPELAGDVACDQVVDLVDAHQRPGLLVAQGNAGMDEELLGELDDGAVCATHVMRGPPLRAQPRHDVDDELDLVRQQGVEPEEGIGRQLGQADVGADGGAGGQASPVGVEQPAEHLLAPGVLGEHATAGDLRDVGRLQVDLDGESIHQARQLDAAGVDAAHQLGELFLGGDDQPHLAAAHAAQALDQRLEIEHLLDVARDELPHFVHHEHQRAPGATSVHEFLAALGEGAGGHVSPVLGSDDPGVRGGIGGGIEFRHHAAGLAQREGDLGLLLVPVLVEDRLVARLEVVETALGFQVDLQLGDVDVLGVAEVTDKAPVHDLGHALVGRTDAAVGGDVEDDGVGGDALGDLLQQHLELGAVAAAGSKQLGRGRAADVAVGQGQSKDLGKAGLAGAEEPGDPDADALVGVGRRLVEPLQDPQVMVEDGIRDDVFLDLAAEDGVVGLVNLDDLLDGAVHLTGEQFLDAWHGRSKDAGAVVEVRVEDAHEAEAGGTFHFAGVEQDGGDVQSSLHLLEERVGPIHGKEGPGAVEEHDVLRRRPFGGKPRGDQLHEGPRRFEEAVDGIHHGVDAGHGLVFEHVLRGIPLRRDGVEQAFRQGNPGDALALVLQAGGEEIQLATEVELVLGRVVKDRVGHVVVGAQPGPRVWLAEDAFEIVLEAVLPVHGTRDWAKAFKLGWGSESWRMLPAPS